MPPKTALALAATLATSMALPASATTLVTSLAALQAGTTGAITTTASPGTFDLTQLNSPVTSSIGLRDGTSLGLSNAAAVTTANNGGFPFRFADGFAGEIFIPQDASGSYLTTETISFSNAVTSLGFEVAPYANSVGAPNFGVPAGPFTVTATLSNGQTTTVSLPGGNLNTGTTTSQFFGFFGGGVTSVTLSSTDPTAIGFGNFVDLSVPEPASAAVLLAGLAGLVARRRARIA